MKFLEGFLGLLALSIGLLYAGFNLIIHTLLNWAMIISGFALLALNAFALLVWFVNWKYYPES